MAAVSGLGAVSVGTVFGFSAVLLPQLEEEDRQGWGDEEEQKSWIGEIEKGEGGANRLFVGRKETFSFLFLPHFIPLPGSPPYLQ